VVTDSRIFLTSSMNGGSMMSTSKLAEWVVMLVRRFSDSSYNSWSLSRAMVRRASKRVPAGGAGTSW